MDTLEPRTSDSSEAGGASRDPGAGGEASAPARSLAALYEEHARNVLAAAFRVTGSRQDAEDVLQTVFLRLSRRWDGLELRDSVGGYLHRAAVNGSLDLLRSRSRAGSVPLDDLVVELPETGEASAERQLEGREFRRRLRQALVRLSDKAARVFALRYFEGLGNTEIATMLGMPRVSVAVTLHRARKQLQVELAQFAEGEVS